MKKIRKTNELLWIFGIIFVALGVSICSKANLGVSMIAAPAFIISEALLPLHSLFTVGVVEYIFQGLLLFILCVVIRNFNWRFLLAFSVAVLYGYTLDFFLWTLSGIEFNSILLRWIMLVVGDCITAFGVACFFKTYMPLQVYELFVSELTSKFKVEISKTKSMFDISLLFISVILALVLFGDVKTFDWSSFYYSSFHNIGLGTFVTTIINAPLISFSGKIIGEIFEPTPRFSKLEKLLKRN